MTDITFFIKQIVVINKKLVRIMHIVMDYLPDVSDSGADWDFDSIFSIEKN